MARKKHKDVEFAVSAGRGSQGRGPETVFSTWDEACVAAMSQGAAHGNAAIDVLVHSRAGAKWYGGSDAVEAYKEDPEASVFERFEIRVNMVGRVP